MRKGKAKLSLETVLESFVDAYRKILKTWIPEIEVYEPVYEDDLPKGNDEKKRQSPTDEASEELANMNESAKEIGVENDKNKALIYFQNLVDMGFNKEKAGLNCRYENGTGEKAHEINQAEEIQVEKDEHKALKDCERLTEIETETDEQTRVKDKHKALSCYKKSAGMDLVDEAMERDHINGIGIEQDEEPDTTNNLERAYEVWKEKVEKLKTSRKSKNKDSKEPEKYERRTLNLAYEVWTARVEKFKRMIRSPYEPVQSEKREIADEVNLDAETPGKDNDQPIQSPQDLKSGPQELTVTNSPRTEEKMCTFGPKNKKKPWPSGPLGTRIQFQL
ncbi:hypothetical protein F8M41_000974 [Gigaspora margarita]|uniref:Uncharacterized protein n=1 Tax=Gigaspora margarita TaxID=4874 RepID=A0A8H3XI43_GIGMA|nr:hypothetical protein F8M41_000974 [Gigaspora margarita]